MADFGLAEDIYSTDYYRQTKDENTCAPVKLPVKWMALESLHDGLFNEKTDVVSEPFQEGLKLHYTILVVIWSVVLGDI